MKRSLKIKNVICGIVIAACLGNGYGAEPGTVWLIGAVPLPGLAKPLFGVQHPQDVPADGQRPQFCTPRKVAVATTVALLLAVAANFVIPSSTEKSVARMPDTAASNLTCDFPQGYQTSTYTGRAYYERPENADLYNFAVPENTCSNSEAPTAWQRFIGFFSINIGLQKEEPKTPTLVSTKCELESYGLKYQASTEQVKETTRNSSLPGLRNAMADDAEGARIAEEQAKATAARIAKEKEIAAILAKRAIIRQKASDSFYTSMEYLQSVIYPGGAVAFCFLQENI